MFTNVFFIDIYLKIIQHPSQVIKYHVFSLNAAQSASSCGGVALAVSVGGKFSDWFKILQ